MAPTHHRHSLVDIMSEMTVGAIPKPMQHLPMAVTMTYQYGAMGKAARIATEIRMRMHIVF